MEIGQQGGAQRCQAEGELGQLCLRGSSARALSLGTMVTWFLSAPPLLPSAY